MILHLLIYSEGTERQFARYVINQFSSPDCCSEFAIMTSLVVSESFPKESSVKVVDPGNEEAMAGFLGSLDSYSAVILHGLFEPWCETVLRHVPPHVKVAWAFWGGEIYGRSDLSKAFLSKRSKRLLRLRQLKLRLKNKKQEKHFELPVELFKRIDYCLTDIHEDYEFVKSYCGFEAKELWYNYYSIEETLGDLRDKTVDGNNILIGNSSTLECNHLDGFDAARKIGGHGSRVIVPLSYGESWLRVSLLRIGKCMFGERFHPLVDFMPREEYNKIISSCAVVIMPHYRPQAFGNLLTALWLGAKVVMSEKSLLYAFFRRIGIIVFSIETDLKKANHFEPVPLSDEERQANRTLIASLYNKEVMACRNKELVEVLERNL